MPSNCPHWNPGPGEHEVLSTYKGGKVEPGADMPRTVFGKSQKLVSPEDRFSATVFLSEVRGWRAEQGLERGRIRGRAGVEEGRVGAGADQGRRDRAGGFGLRAPLRNSFCACRVG